MKTKTMAICKVVIILIAYANLFTLIGCVGSISSKNYNEPLKIAIDDKEIENKN